VCFLGKRKRWKKNVICRVENDGIELVEGDYSWRWLKR
jgi:hypothetical protein